jgi:hypothetical protein
MARDPDKSLASIVNLLSIIESYHEGVGLEGTRTCEDWQALDS